MNFKKILFIAGCGLALSLGKINAQSATFNYTGSLQTWTVPCGVTSVTINATGAEGGGSTGYTYDLAGLGASITSQAITVTSGDVIDIIAGGTGVTGNYGGGGGGGTYVWDATSTTLLVVGGGGGGAGYYSSTYNGGNGQTNTSTLNTPTNAVPGGYTAAGGSGGNGGTGGSGYSWAASGGAGWSSNGGIGTGAGSGTVTGGNDPANGGAGGGGGSNYGVNGGYGGGGGGDVSGGGGGGYNGGGGGGINGNYPYGGGDGGGSYCVSGTPTTSTNSGNGYATINWTVPSTLVASASITTNISCNGGNNGSASSTVTGGSTPYTYAWTGGGTNATVSGLTAGSYTVTVHDACGNMAAGSVTITQPTAIVASASVTTNVLCNGGNSGSASSTVTGGTGAYTYAWTGGGSNSSITGLTAGTYNLNVQDANGCTGSATVTITQPNMLAVAATETANVLCSGGSTGSASSTVTGGTGAYTYAWTGGGTKDTAVGLSAGTYTLAVQDANGCTGTAMVTITEPSALAIVKHATADNGSSNGKAWVTVSGGTMPYTYAWTGGNTTDSISGQAKGTYCCTVKDANGCMDSVCIKIVSTAGVDGIVSNGGQITVYPNPNNGQFTIQSSLNAVSTVEVYNVLGEKVFSGNLNAGNNTINMSNQSTGIYLYRVMSESGTLISEGKISVQK